MQPILIKLTTVEGIIAINSLNISKIEEFNGSGGGSIIEMNFSDSNGRVKYLVKDRFDEILNKIHHK